MRTVGPSRAKPAWRRWKFDWLAPKKPGQYTLLVRANMPTGPPGRAPPAPCVVVIQFESLEKLQALYESGPYKQAVAIGDKYATQRIFGVEGILPRKLFDGGIRTGAISTM